MKTNRYAGQFNLKGKKSKTLRCGCCSVRNLKEAYQKQLDKQEVRRYYTDAPET